MTKREAELFNALTRVTEIAVAILKDECPAFNLCRYTDDDQGGEICIACWEKALFEAARLPDR